MKKLLCFLCIAALLFSCLSPASVNADNPTLISEKVSSLQTEPGSNYFSYYPADSWQEGAKIEEYFTSVDTRKAENPADIYYTLTFFGNSVELFGYKSFNHTIVNISIDNGEKTEVDTYNASRTSGPVSLIKYEGLSNTRHTVKVEATGRSNAAASGGAIQISHANITKEPIQATGIELPKMVQLFQGSEQKLTYTFFPEQSTANDLIFAIEDTSIASVTSDGIIRGMLPGTTTLTVSSVLGKFTKDTTILVKKPNEDMHAVIVEPDTHYTQDRYQEISNADCSEETLWAWKADKAISEIAMISKDKALSNVTVSASEFVSSNQRHTLPEDCIKTYFLKEVKAFIGHAGWYAQNPNCIMPTGPKEDIPDVIYSEDPMNLEPNRVQPIWVEFSIPKDVPAGVYTGTICISSDSTEETVVLSYQVEVLNTELPAPEDYLFDVEYWQHPYNSAYYYDVEPFSEKHLSILKEEMELYKSLGGHSVTASIVEEAWGGQTYGPTSPHYPSMIKWTKKADQSWSFDYTHFDKWVALNKEVGIGDKIICYSMLPWNGQITYHDEATNSTKTMTATGSDKDAYRNIWKPFLTDFVKHLDEKDWFDTTYMGYDERSNMATSFEIIDEITNKDGHTLKKSAAFNNFTSNRPVFEQLEYAAVGLQQIRDNLSAFQSEVESRREAGKDTALYTATEHFPNSFTKSMPVESYWSIMYAGSLNTTGFLRWAFDAWVEDPLEDSTHCSFQAGDCFLVYPDEKESTDIKTKFSVRLARLDEGVRDLNKLYLMREYSPEFATKVSNLLKTIKKNYGYDTVQTPSSWAVAGRPAKWANEASRKQIPADMSIVKKQIYELSKEYAEAVNPTIPVTGVTLNRTEITLTAPNETFTLIAEITPENATNPYVSWVSSDPSVVSVNTDGLVTAVSNGEASITAITEDGQKTAICTIKVKIPQETEPPKTTPVTGVSLNKSSAVLTSSKEKLQLIATVLPQDADNKNVKWTSSDSKIALVDSTGLVTALTDGTAKITVATEDGQKTAFCTITVQLSSKDQDTTKTLKAPTSLKASKNKLNSLTLSWKSVKNASSYTVEKYNQKTKKWKRVKKVTKTHLQIKKLSPATLYKFRVKASYENSNTLIESKYTTLKTATLPPKPQLQKPIPKGSTKAVLKWKKISGVTGYKIYMKTNKGNYRLLTAKKPKETSFTKSGLKKGTSYTFRIRSYIKVNGKTLYSSYSASKKLLR